jgi:hypothetical protein
MPLYAVPQLHRDNAGYQTEVNVFLVKEDNADKALILVKEDREVNPHGHYEYDEVVEVRGEDIQNIYHADDR